MSRTFVQDYGVLEDAKIVQDDDKYLIVKAVIASEMVQSYRNEVTGKIEHAFKSADELEKAVWTVNGVPIKALSHPRGDHIEDTEEVNGKVEDPVFRKDLNDPKTKRPCRRGIEGKLKFYRDNAPEVKQGPFKPISEETALAIRTLTLRDNSPGFTCYKDYTPGEFQGQHYDYVQRKIFVNHLAAPIAKGRCPSPLCGIAVDAADELDVWEETEESIRSGHGDKGKFDKDSFRTIDITEGVKAVVACPKGKYENGKCTVGMESQSFIFSKDKFTVEQAKAWFEKHHVKDSASLAEYFSCPVCRSIDDVGPLEAGRRLMKQYGADVLGVIEGHKATGTAAADGLSIQEINAKIQALYDRKDEAVKKQHDLWAKREKEVVMTPEQEQLSRELEGVDAEIKAFRELMAKKVVEGVNTASGAAAPAVANDCDSAIVRNRKALQDLKVFLDVF
ncbi:DUF2213 domain-containing protein [Candidatus Bathyarchaeota archaeon]|nr:DUF2213 domain-containing protein [Candidatus Bathyarchaeota archaeon]